MATSSASPAADRVVACDCRRGAEQGGLTGAAALLRDAIVRLGVRWHGLRGGMLVAGTTSDAGKSWLVTGLCRLLARNGVRVAPFKGQNMALNAAVTPGGAEIGHAQWVHALAAGVEAEAAMNPVLLKPTGERSSQVIVLGEAIGDYPAGDYHRTKQHLRPVVLDALADLRSRFDVVLCEGAGGAAEINLLDGDLANLPLAHAAGLPAIVVGDIDRGGVFASLYGTVALLPDHLRQHVRGFVINRLRGDPALLGDACADLHRRCGVPTLGVVPMLPGTDIDAEDSLGLDRWSDVSNGTPADLDVAVIRLPHLSNAGDLDPLRVEPGVAVRLVSSPHQLGRPDLIVLPGSKTTVADLEWLRSAGLAAAIERSHAVVLGICAGAQMLGARLDDPDAVESGRRSVVGLGLLDLTTAFLPGKVLDRPSGSVLTGIGAGTPVAGYRIHNGRVTGGAEPWIASARGDVLGWQGGRFLGTTLHGLLESDGFRRALLDGLLARSRRVRRHQHATVPFAAIRTARFDAIADALEQHLDVPALCRLIESA